MKTSNRNVSRRLVLRGLGGTALGLPFLESLTGPVEAQAGGKPQFFLVLNTQNGVRQAARGESETFWLRKDGPLTSAAMAQESDRTLSVLSPYADDLAILKGINLAFNPTGNGAHHNNSSQLLTGSKVKVVGKHSHPTHMSIDRLIADELNTPGIGPMTAMAGGAAGHYISTDEDGVIRSAASNPMRLFEQIVGSNSGDSAEAQEAISSRRRFVNDELRGEFQALEQDPRLGLEDRLKLEAHRSLIQDVETKLCSLENQDLRAKLDDMNTRRWHESKNGFIDAAELHIQVLTLAVACGHTYAGTLQVGNMGGAFAGTVGGVNVTNYHAISHRVAQGGDKDRETHRHIDIMYFERLYGPWIGLLKERGLLNNGVTMWMNQSKDGMHGRDNVPHILAGNAGGFLKTGYQTTVNVFNDHLLNTLINATGVRKPDGSLWDDFGNKGTAKGVVEEIMA